MSSTRKRRIVLSVLGVAMLAGTKKAEGYKYIRVYDTKGDSDSGYGLYHRQASPSTEGALHNKSGSGTHATSGTGSKILDQKACVSLDFQPDRCSGKVSNP